MSKTIKELAEKTFKSVNNKEAVKNVLEGMNITDELVSKHPIKLARVATSAYAAMKDMKKTSDYDDIQAWTALTAFIFTEGYMTAIRDGKVVSKDEDNS